MTSRSGVDAVLRELRFGAVPVAAAAGPGATAGPTTPGSVSSRTSIRPSAGPMSPTTRQRRRPATTTPCARASSRCSMKPRRRWPGAPRPRCASSTASSSACCCAHSENASGGSASHRSHVGCCLLTNLHQPAEAALVAIEAVTHESIHQLLYRTEQAGGNFCDLARDADLPLAVVGRSPAAAFAGACVLRLVRTAHVVERAGAGAGIRRRSGARARAHRLLPVRIRVSRRPARQPGVSRGQRRPAGARRHSRNVGCGAPRDACG